MVVAAGVPFAIETWKNLLTDKRSYAERFEDCRRTRLESWVGTYRGPNPEAALEKRWAEIGAECRAKGGSIKGIETVSVTLADNPYVSGY